MTYTEKNTEYRKDTRYTGTFDSNARGFGFVKVEGFERDLFIPEGCDGGAMYGDTVEVRILRGSESEGGYFDNSRGKRAEAEVTAILERGIKQVVGTYHPFGRPLEKTYSAPSGSGKKGKRAGFTIAGVVTPDNPKIPFEVDIPVGKEKSAMQGHKVVADLTRYSVTGEDPVGQITEILGHITDPGVDILSLVRGYGIPTEFPEEALKEAGRLPDHIEYDPEEETGLMDAGASVSARRDLRALPTVTIDGEDTKDIDDAISLVREEGLWKLGVHIADVAEYVTEGSALDKEALNRGTSVYLADRVIPMLPRKLSNGICSLNAGEDRLAMSCLMTIDDKGEVTDYEITESVIHVDARLSYNGVMRLFTEGDDSEIAQSLAWQGYRGIKGRTLRLARMLRKMRKLAALLKKKREERGSIDFDFPEAKVVLDETGRPIEIAVRERTEETDLIEDFMLLANETVARHCVFLEIPSVYRVHGAPAADRMRELAQFVRGFGYRFRPGQGDVHPSQIRDLLEKLKGTPEEGMLSRMVLRCMQRAQYATGCEGHFGLALSYYCHFTSPIRRYPDLLVHRSLKYWLRGEMTADTIDRLNLSLPGAALRSSAMEQRAAEAERETVKLKKAQYMEGKVGETHTGIISGITSWGIYVELPDTVEGMIRISDLTDDFYYYDDKQYILVGEYTGAKYTLGQKMDIEVSGADPMRRTVDFVPADFRQRSFDREDRRKGSSGAGSGKADGRNAGRESEKKKAGKETGKKKKSLRMDRTGRVLSGKAGRAHGKARRRKGNEKRKGMR
ncbi:MAG TPA: ribonuclease R [Lachnospiraceae bacterium]|nr:ribonuclease R [Lachnospiraceae bacterium]